MRHLKVSFIVLAALLVCLTCNVAVLGQSQAPSPQALIKNMAERYAALSSYQDSGVVETVSVDSLPRRSTDIFFKTYFTRPNKLRFEWLDYSSLSSLERSVIWSDGVKIFSFYAFEPERVETVEHIGMAVAGATGVSSGAAHTVPNLLLSEVGGFSLTDLKRLSLMGEEVFEGEGCYVVEGYHPNGEPWRLWVSKKDSLLRKLRVKNQGGGFQEQVHRDIRVDEKVSEAIYRPKLVGGRVTDVLAKEKEADIRRLLELIAPRERINQQLNDVLSLLKTAMPQVPEKTWQEVIAELRLDSDMVLQIYVPIYDWHYTGDEIKQLIGLYESTLGQKMRRSSDLIELEATRRGENLGEELMKRIQEKLRAKGYKLPAA